MSQPRPERVRSNPNSRREALQKGERLFADAARRFSQTLTAPDLPDGPLSESQAAALFEPNFAQQREFIRGYSARFAGEPRDRCASSAWCAGWDTCKADIGKLKAISAVERRSLEQMVAVFKLRQPATEAAAP